MTRNPDLALVLFALFLWGVGFLSQYFGSGGWIAPRWFKLLLGVWKHDQRVDFNGALWQLWGFEALIFINPNILPQVLPALRGGLFLTVSYFANIFILKKILRR